MRKSKGQNRYSKKRNIVGNIMENSNIDIIRQNELYNKEFKKLMRLNLKDLEKIEVKEWKLI